MASELRDSLLVIVTMLSAMAIFSVVWLGCCVTELVQQIEREGNRRWRL